MSWLLTEFCCKRTKNSNEENIMKKKSNKKHGVVTCLISEEEHVQNIMQAGPCPENSNCNHKLIWDSKKRQLSGDIKDTPLLPIRREDIRSI